MKTTDLNFEQFVNEEKIKKEKIISEDNSSEEVSNIFERLANPPTDFLTGSQLVEDSVALKAAQEIGSARAKELGCEIQWSGTTGKVMKNGQFIETTKIHGVTWDREHQEAFAVRMDLTNSQDS